MYLKINIKCTCHVKVAIGHINRGPCLLKNFTLARYRYTDLGQIQIYDCIT